ncbi:MAG TPA: histidine kinase dimerization/phospho-acceptor domain-containing protein [Pyrinomonadaceae bacterium]|nr:histidine kinase dimerization/phospho-acceptor domain-containing protein [Pyrinomonadaceae bacterium]
MCPDDSTLNEESGALTNEERLRALVAEYETKLSDIIDLVARVRHEINNPLTGVIGQAQLLLREPLGEKARQRVETIEQLAGRIRDTVAQLRTVQRAQPHKSLEDKKAEAEMPRHKISS